jgi:hypothetical protein
MSGIAAEDKGDIANHGDKDGPSICSAGITALSRNRENLEKEKISHPLHQNT